MAKKNNYDDSTLKLVGSLWIKTAKESGKKFISVSMENPENPDHKFRLVGFKNKKKTEDKQPDYLLFFDTEAQQEDTGKANDFDDEEETEEDDDDYGL